MEALLLTAAVVGLAVVGYALVARTWPRSSSLGGYRARLRGDRDDASDGPTAPGVREDDDVRWSWTGDDDRREDDPPG